MNPTTNSDSSKPLAISMVAVVLALAIGYVCWPHEGDATNPSADQARVVANSEMTRASEESPVLQPRIQIEESEVNNAASDNVAAEPTPPTETKLESPSVRSIDEMLTFFPKKYPQGEWNPAGLQFEDCWFTTNDNVELHGWYCHHPNARAVVLFAHGNAGNLAGRAPVLKILNERLNLSVMIFDYRGYGRSKGTPTVKGVLEDARAARKWLAEREKISSSEIVLLGRSLGGGIMVDLAANDGARGLVLECTFTSLRAVAENMYPKWMVRAVMRDKLNSQSQIDKYEGPVLISHGNADSVIPFSHGQTLFETANDPKTFFQLDGLDHNDPQTDEYYIALGRFIDSL